MLAAPLFSRGGGHSLGEGEQRLVGSPPVRRSSLRRPSVALVTAHERHADDGQGRYGTRGIPPPPATDFSATPLGGSAIRPGLVATLHMDPPEVTRADPGLGGDAEPHAGDTRRRSGTTPPKQPMSWPASAKQPSCTVCRHRFQATTAPSSRAPAACREGRLRVACYLRSLRRKPQPANAPQTRAERGLSGRRFTT